MPASASKPNGLKTEAGFIPCLIVNPKWLSPSKNVKIIKMFTGIIEETGSVKNLRSQGKILRLTVNGKKTLDDLKIGDSIAINGVCLTAVEKGRGHFSVDVLEETASLSNLGRLKVGDSVNLERAMKAGDRFSGHIVSGHIDGVVTVKNISNSGGQSRFVFNSPSLILKHVVKKGSISLNGISLTVYDISKNTFSVNVIPHTFKETNFSKLKPSDIVNAEVDMMSKYIEKHLSNESRDGMYGNIKMSNAISDFLEMNGGSSQCN